ncbi:MAG: dihydrodipicolinate reductase, partial [Desulfobacteraceae bacterium]|nr:dihydrodipicolinate reductase [Desulfobacteraceae bacterium]
MAPIKIMINGLPGNVASVIADRAVKDQRFEVIPSSLTGPEITAKEHPVGDQSFRLIHPQNRQNAIDS